MDWTDNGAPPCPNCGSNETGYGEYGVACHNDGDLGLDNGCPIVFFKDQ